MPLSGKCIMGACIIVGILGLQHCTMYCSVEIGPNLTRASLLAYTLNMLISCGAMSAAPRGQPSGRPSAYAFVVRHGTAGLGGQASVVVACVFVRYIKGLLEFCDVIK